jgi:hypothetical protein
MFNTRNLHFFQMRFTFTGLKRIFTILLAVIYLVVSSGLIMELHHCMGKLAGSSVSLFGKQHQDKCDNCGMEDKTNTCCKDEVKLVKIQDSHKQVSSDNAAPIPPIAEAELASPLSAIDIIYNSSIDLNWTDHTPLANGPARCILLCVFRI